MVFVKIWTNFNYLMHFLTIYSLGVVHMKLIDKINLAKADPESAKSLLKDSKEFSSDDLCEIAQSHPQTALFILQDEALKRKILADTFVSSFLSKIAKSHPDAAQFILQNKELTEGLFSSRGLEFITLQNIARSHLVTKNFILNDPALRERFGDRKVDQIKTLEIMTPDEEQKRDRELMAKIENEKIARVKEKQEQSWAAKISKQLGFQPAKSEPEIKSVLPAATGLKDSVIGESSLDRNSQPVRPRSGR